ncbi:MAG TPA: TraR/DksA family transcriptional regulator [Candidatus Paceibacterota bacterium]|nr:TraR/DksA family transcriptional regulator [Candidatus Paceibacterota bacterium]
MKLSQDELEELRVALEAERESLEDDLASHGRVLNETGEWEGSSTGFEGEEADPSDVADQIEELATNVPLVKELEERHTDVTDALDKMEEGIYGRCEECDEPIDLARLKANPAARTCIKHADL